MLDKLQERIHAIAKPQFKQEDSETSADYVNFGFFKKNLAEGKAENYRKFSDAARRQHNFKVAEENLKCKFA